MKVRKSISQIGSTAVSHEFHCRIFLSTKDIVSIAGLEKEASVLFTLVRISPPLFLPVAHMVKLGIDTETREEVAIKLTRIRDGPEALQYEADTYAKLSGCVGIPRVFWFGPEGDFYVLVHELLGPSLEDLFNYCDRKFSLKTVLLIADQAIRRIKHIHNEGYLHCDIKPDNFLLGVGNNGNILYTIDFGLARNMDAAKGHGIRDDRPLGGTARYASLNNHKGLGTLHPAITTLIH